MNQNLDKTKVTIKKDKLLCLFQHDPVAKTILVTIKENNNIENEYEITNIYEILITEYMLRSTNEDCRIPLSMDDLFKMLLMYPDLPPNVRMDISDKSKYESKVLSILISSPVNQNITDSRTIIINKKPLSEEEKLRMEIVALRSHLEDIKNQQNKLTDSITKSKNIRAAWRKYYIATLPKSAWAYEEGELYVRSHYMIEIEQKEKDIFIACIENGGNYKIPPIYVESNECKSFYKNKKLLFDSAH